MQAESKQPRLAREEHDVVSSSMQLPSEGSSQLTGMQSSESHATAGPHSMARAQHIVSTAATSQQEASVIDAKDEAVVVSRDGQVAHAAVTCLPPAQGNQGLSTFLAAYGSDSDSDVG